MLSDLHLTLRNLAKSRGFAIISIITLAVGIGAATAIYSALRALVVDPFDYPESAQLSHVWSGEGWPLSPADFHDLHQQSTSFDSFGAYTPDSVNIGAENAQAVFGVRSTYGVLPAFGVRPARGRWFEPADDVEGAPPVAIISHALWLQTFGGNPNLIGSSVRLNGTNTTVVGIMPSGFEFASPWMRTADIQVWLPYQMDEKELGQRDSHWLCGIARLGEGKTIGSADAEIKSIGRHLTSLYPNSNARKEFLVRSLHYEMTKDVGSQVWMLFGAVALVLLVACANVASMLLARSAQRTGEFGVRVALGATRGNLVRLALTESLVIAIIGALLGIGLAFGGIEVLKSIAPASEARKAAMTLDGTVLLFAFGATLITALLAGIPPALAAMRTSLSTVIRQDTRGAVGSKSRHRMLRNLIVTQVAVAFILANAAALFSGSYLKLLEDNQALATDYVLSARINLRGERYDDDAKRVEFWQQAAERVAALPGVTSAALASKLPLQGGSNTDALINDEVYDPTQRRMSVERSSITPSYFETMGITLLQGRNLQNADDMNEDGILGVVVNRTLAEKAWPDQDPIGETLRGNSPDKPWYVATVVGVVEDVRQWGASADVRPEMYTTPPKSWGNSPLIVVRSSQPAAFLAPIIRREINAMDGELALQEVRTLNELLAEATQSERAVAGLINFFMAATLGLVAVGLYGTLSYQILQRTREIGVRMAIGALSGDILRLVFGQGIRWVAIGVVLGIGGTFALSSVLESTVHGMEGLTATPLILASLAVTISATIAIWLPARRAAKLDPLTALRID
jgi:putative ABC transport system permease protein